MTRRRAAVLGHPISHSLSPVLHRAAYRALGLAWDYDAIDVTEDEVLAFLGGLDETWAGLSVTAPLKAAVIPALDSVSELAARAGAVNTVVVAPDAGELRLAGHNTDVAGMVAACAEAGVVTAPSVGIVGAGGTAAAALLAAEQLGARSVLISARREEAAADLAGRVGVPAEVVPWTRVGEVLSRRTVIVTLPGDAAARLAPAVPATPGLLLDVTYHPWPTTLARRWQERGGVAVPGHRMLLWQAVEQVRLMTGCPPPADDMAEALAEELAHRF